MIDHSRSKNSTHSSECLLFQFLTGARLYSECQTKKAYFFSSVFEAAAFFSYSSFTSQHFDLRNSLFKRPFFSAHLWASSSVFAFGQSAWQVVTRFGVLSFANAWNGLRLNVRPMITKINFMNTPYLIRCYEFDKLAYLHDCASMFLSKIEPTEVFQALGDKTRLQIMRIMAAVPEEEICSCEMTQVLEESESNVSRYLKALRQSGLLAAEKEGRWVYHRVSSSVMASKFCEVIRGLPDSDGTLARDVSRFKAELKKRTSPRCRRTDSVDDHFQKRQRAR